MKIIYRQGIQSLYIKGGDLMAFKGYFLKIGSDFTLQKKHYANNTLKMGKEIIINDSYVDANDVTHEYASNHTPEVVSWTTPNIRLSTAQEILIACRNRNNLSCEYYDFETDSYKSGIFKATIGDVTPLKTIDNNITIVAPFSVKLEEY